MMLSCDVKTRFDSQLSRMNCQMFSTGLSSGLFEGIATIEMLVGSSSLGVRCQPAWSISSTAWAPGAMASDISAR